VVGTGIRWKNPKKILSARENGFGGLHTLVPCLAHRHHRCTLRPQDAVARTLQYAAGWRSGHGALCTFRPMPYRCSRRARLFFRWTKSTIVGVRLELATFTGPLHCVQSSCWRRSQSVGPKSGHRLLAVQRQKGDQLPSASGRASDVLKFVE